MNKIYVKPKNIQKITQQAPARKKGINARSIPTLN